MEFLSLTAGCTGSSEYSCQNATLLEITCCGSNFVAAPTPCVVVCMLSLSCDVVLSLLSSFVFVLMGTRELAVVLAVV